MNANNLQQGPPQMPGDSSKAIQVLLETIQTRFQLLSDSIIQRIDDMGNRIDDLERSIATLMKENDENKAESPSTPVKKQEDRLE